MTTFPDITALLVSHLGSVVTPKPVSSDIPDPRPAEWLQVRRVGGTKRPPVRDQPRVDLIAWAATELAAFTLIDQVRVAVNALHGTTLGGIQVYRVEETMGPRSGNDPLSGSATCWMTVAILIRADAAIR